MTRLLEKCDGRNHGQKKQQKKNKKKQKKTKKQKQKKTKKQRTKKTLKRNPEAKCMVCTWLKNAPLLENGSTNVIITLKVQNHAKKVSI